MKQAECLQIRGAIEHDAIENVHGVVLFVLLTCKPQMKLHSCSNISAVEVYLTFDIFLDLDNTVMIFLFISMAFIQYSGVIFIGGPLNFQNSFEVRTALSTSLSEGQLCFPWILPFPQS